MEKEANSYYFSPSEKAILKSLIDKRYGRITTPVDYASEALLPKKDVTTLIEGRIISFKSKDEWPSFSTEDYNEYIISKIRESL